MRNKRHIPIILCFLALFIAFYPSTFADTISDVNHSVTVPLLKNFIVTGQYDGTTDNEILCSLRFFDEDYAPIDRPSDEYTFLEGSIGAFYFQYLILEPTFKRDQNYFYRVNCGDAQYDSNFLVQQPEAMAFVTSKNIEYFTDKNNLDPIFFFISILMIVGFVGLMFYVIAIKGSSAIYEWTKGGWLKK